MAAVGFLNPRDGVKCAPALKSMMQAPSLACDRESGYSFWVIQASPTGAQIPSICASAACKNMIANMQRIAPTECVMYDGFFLYGDILNPILAQCSTAINASGDSASAKNDGEKGGLGIGSIIGIVVAVVVVLGGAVLYLRRKRQRNQNHQQYAPQTQYYDVEAPVRDVTPTGVTTTYKSANKTPHTNGTSDTAGSSAMTGTSTYTGPRPVDIAAIPLFQDALVVHARLPYDEVEIKAFLDNGAYGAVYKGQYQNQVVAIKKLRTSHASDVIAITKFMEEVKLLASLSHPRIVTFVGVAWTKPEDVCAVIEFMEGGDLLSLLQRFDQDRTKPMGFDPLKLKIALHVAEALTYLHTRWPVVIHRDLKSTNILLNTQYDAKVTDFGVSREHADENMTMKVGTQRWMAPEIINGQDYDEKADVFSFGVVLSELDTNKIPYATHEISGMTPLAMMQSVARGQLTVEFSYSSDPRIVALGRECVSINPRDRPTMDEARRRIEAIMQ